MDIISTTQNKGFPGSRRYWIRRYRRGGNSGDGSYGELAAFKADIVNKFLEEHEVGSVIEYGFGDGNQLRAIRYPQYLGFDVSSDALRICSELFRDDASKSFKLAGQYSGQKADLAVSLDVIFHLVEDHVFHSYMERLLDSAMKYAIIYSSNFETLDSRGVRHVRHRKFTDWIENHRPAWVLESHIPNRYPFKGDNKTGSLADFYVFRHTIS